MDTLYKLSLLIQVRQKELSESYFQECAVQECQEAQLVPQQRRCPHDRSRFRWPR